RWVFRQRRKAGESITTSPGWTRQTLGYIEFSGRVRRATRAAVDTLKLKADGHYKQSFQILRMATLNVERWADKLSNLSLFYRWQDPVWKGQTVSLR
ncbi:MAG: hypothetical protein IPI89_00195, partial [Propionivibrio sp.]|nr:hypothetical protein [Propionivibrio sp.]